MPPDYFHPTLCACKAAGSHFALKTEGVLQPAICTMLLKSKNKIHHCIPMVIVWPRLRTLDTYRFYFVFSFQFLYSSSSAVLFHTLLPPA